MSVPGGVGTTVVIGGNSAGAVTAAEEAATAFESMGADIASIAADLQASFAELDASMAELQAGVAETGAAMGDLGAEMEAASASVEAASAEMSTAILTMDEGDTSIISLSDAFDAAVTAGDGLTEALGGMMGGLMPLIQQAALFVTVLAGWQILQQVSGWVQNLIQQMFQLDETTQRTVNSWQYLFGSKQTGQQLAGWSYNESPNLPFTAMDLRGAVSTLGTAGYSANTIEQFIPVLADIASTYGASAYGGQGVTLSQAANAIRSASFGLTRMLRTDLGISPDQLLAYGLAGSKTATGVRITNMATLIPAIEKWAAAKGLTAGGGAAQEQETTTFWGAYSSFQDYTQNMLQTIGGLNPETGLTDPNTMFAAMQQGLFGINSILGENQAAEAAGTTGTSGTQTAAQREQAARLAAMLGTTGRATGSTQAVTPTLQGGVQIAQNILGGGSEGIINFFKGLLDGLKDATPALDKLYQSLQSFGKWLESSGAQQQIEGIGKALGSFLGNNITSIINAWPQLSAAFNELATAIEGVFGNASGSSKQRANEFGGAVVEALAAIVTFVADVIGALVRLEQFLTAVGQAWDDFRKAVSLAITTAKNDVEGDLNAIKNLFEGWGNDLRKLWHQFGQDMINLFTQGMREALPNLIGEVDKVAGAIAAKLHFSKPEEGPLATADMWMPDMMLLFAQGIERGLPQVAMASTRAAQAIGAPIQAIQHLLAGNTTNYGPSTTYGGGNTANLSVYGAGDVQIMGMISNVLRNLDRTGALNFQQPGGMYLFGMH